MMTGKVSKQLITFQKTLFENSFNTMGMIQDQTEQLISSVLPQLPWMNEEAKKAINEWIASYKKMRTDFKKSVDDGFSKMEDTFARQ